jgi:hypothetical protein
MGTATVWPLAQPIRGDDPGGQAPWRDNAFLSFWDPARNAYGTLHVSTSPNSGGRRARLSLSVDGLMREIIEPLEPGSFSSASMSFDLGSGRAVAGAPGIELDLETAPLFAIADFRAKGVIPRMGGEPLQHFQTTVAVSGHCRIDGRETSIDGRGIRDRTWGHRDESVNISEYMWIFVTFADMSVTAMRFLGDGEHDVTDGFALDECGCRPVQGMAITRDAAGLCAGATLKLADGNVLELRSGGRRAGFWVPMGDERAGPAMSCFDEFASFTTANGVTGFGLAEHGVVRKLF